MAAEVEAASATKEAAARGAAEEREMADPLATVATANLENAMEEEGEALALAGKKVVV